MDNCLEQTTCSIDLKNSFWLPEKPYRFLRSGFPGTAVTSMEFRISLSKPGKLHIHNGIPGQDKKHGFL